MNNPFTIKEMEEYIKCSKDVKYFIENYVIIHTLDGPEPLKLRDYQGDTIDVMNDNRFSIIRNSRQVGMSTLANAYMLHYVIFNSDKTVVSLHPRTCMKNHSRDSFGAMYNNLPDIFKHEVLENNKSKMRLSNGTKIRFISESTGICQLRGFAISLFVVQDMKFMKNQTDMMRSIYPTIASTASSKMILTSGNNPDSKDYTFDGIWDLACDPESGSNYIPHSINWDHVPGRGFKWKAEQVKVLGLEQFELEFCVESI